MGTRVVASIAVFATLLVAILASCVGWFRRRVPMTCGGRTFWMRRTRDRDRALELLCRVTYRASVLIDALPTTEPAVVRLKRRFARAGIHETPRASRAVAYTEDKVDVYLCLRDKGRLAADDAIFFVLIHELAHVMSDSIGHTSEFRRNHRLLLDAAESMGLYDPRPELWACESRLN